MRGKIYTNPKIYTFRPRKEPESFEISPKAIWFLLGLVVIVGIIYFFLFSPYFKIKNLYIEGAGDYEEDISKIIHSKLREKDNIFLFQNQAVQDEITKNYSVFSKITIIKGFPDALKIALEVRNPVLIYKFQNSQYLIDDEGIAFTKEKIPENLPVITKNEDIEVGEKIFTKDFVEFIKIIWSEFPAKTNLKITKIDILETDFVIDIYTSKNFKVIFDTTKDPHKQLENVAIILPVIGNQKIKYIDVRIEGKIYYK